MNNGLSRRRLLQAVPAGALGLGAAPTASKRRGNVLLITTDQQSSRSLAALGQATGATPHLDALAQRGTLFANSWCVDPSCSPARAAWVMGRPGSETGVVLNRLESRNDLPEMGAGCAIRASTPCFWASGMCRGSIHGRASRWAAQRRLTPTWAIRCSSGRRWGRSRPCRPISPSSFG